MKKIIITSTCFFFVTIIASAQKMQVGAGYNLFLPQGGMKNTFGSGNGLGFDFMVRLKKIPFMVVGADMQYSVYAATTQKQQYVFTDGSTTITDVNLTSSMASAGLKLRFESQATKKVKPYGQVQAGGLGMFSNLYIEDPADPYGCKALESKTLVQDVNWYVGFGGGIKFDIASKKNPGRHFIDVSSNYLMGGHMEYANMGKVHDHETASAPTTDKGAQPLTVKFINVSSNQIHEHQVAEVYNNPINLLQFQVKYVFGFGR